MSPWWPGKIHDISSERGVLEKGWICLKNGLIQIILLEGLFIHPSISSSIRRSVRVWSIFLSIHWYIRLSASGTSVYPAMGRMTIKWTRRSLGHSLLRSLVPSYRSLICLLRTALFARVLHCAHSLARSLAHAVAYELNVSISCSFNPLGICPSVCP